MMQVPRWVVGTVITVWLLGLFLTRPHPAGAQPGAANEAKSYAVLVGVEGYFHRDLRGLKYPVNDVTALSEVLKTSGYEVVLLSDATGEEDKSLAPTKENIDREIRKTLRRCRPQDTVILAFAGHGLQFTGSKDAFFCPQDARPFADETESLVSISGIYRELERSFAGVKIIMVDACRNDPDPGRGRGIDADSSPRPPKGVAALFSCSAGQRAFEHDDLKHGVFFHHVLKGFSGDGSDGRGNVTFYSLAQYLSESVPQTMRQLFPGREQLPNVKADLQGRPPILARIVVPTAMATPASEAVTATFTILHGDADGPPAAGVEVELLYRATATGSNTPLARGTADAEGRATLRVTLGEQHHHSGDFLARVTHDGASKTWTLKSNSNRFPELLNWRIFAPEQSVTLPNETRPLPPPRTTKQSDSQDKTVIMFISPAGAEVAWKTSDNDYTSTPLTMPGDLTFKPGGTYRIRIKKLSGRHELTLYPQIHVYPIHPSAEQYVASNSIPILLSDEEIDLIESGTFVTKVYYRPDAKYRELIDAGVEGEVAVKLLPGQDPVAEADRRGIIIVVLRIGSRDQEPPKATNGSVNFVVGLK